jgi:hypothetical protein
MRQNLNIHLRRRLPTISTALRNTLASTVRVAMLIQDGHSGGDLAAAGEFFVDVGAVLREAFGPVAGEPPPDLGVLEGTTVKMKEDDVSGRKEKGEVVRWVRGGEGGRRWGCGGHTKTNIMAQMHPRMAQGRRTELLAIFVIGMVD